MLTCKEWRKRQKMPSTNLHHDLLAMANNRMTKPTVMIMPSLLLMEIKKTLRL